MGQCYNNCLIISINKEPNELITHVTSLKIWE